MFYGPQLVHLVENLVVASSGIVTKHCQWKTFSSALLAMSLAGDAVQLCCDQRARANIFAQVDILI